MPNPLAFALALAGALGASPAGAAPRTPADMVRPPNILLIVADDVGVADIGTTDPTGVPTPHLDALAAEGVVLTAGYASASMCGPSRAALITGRHAQRYGMEFNVGNLSDALAERRGVPLGEVTLGDALGAAGYTTGAVGKWHLGYNPRFYPTNRGFDDWVGILSGKTSYIDPAQPDAIHVPTRDYPTVGPRAAHEQVIRGPDAVVVANEDEYLTDFLTDEAVTFVEDHAAEPFFLYLSYTAAHTPLQTTTAYWDRFPGIADPHARAYAAMISALDDGVGAVLDRLDTLGIGDDTLVIFASDNGCAPDSEACPCAPLRGLKGTYWEGGARVPFLVRLPNRAHGGTTFDRPTSLLDVFPTALAAAGVPPPPGVAYDGVDLMPWLTGAAAGDPHPVLFWRTLPQVAMRWGDDKLFLKTDGTLRATYDLAADPGETTNLWATGWAPPAPVQDAHAAWEAAMLPPAWPGIGGQLEICGELFEAVH